MQFENFINATRDMHDIPICNLIPMYDIMILPISTEMFSLNLFRSRGMNNYFPLAGEIQEFSQENLKLHESC